MPIKDPKKRRAYQRQRYKATGNPHTAKRRKKLQGLANRYKSLCGCLKCGEKDYRCLDYHHVEKKDRSISVLAVNGNMKSLKAEIRKCIVLCSNCHRKEHQPV